MNSESELFFIVKDSIIKKILLDNKIIILIKRIDFNWSLMCLYWFLYIRDLLIGFYSNNLLIRMGKVIWFNWNGKLIKII